MGPLPQSLWPGFLQVPFSHPDVDPFLFRQACSGVFLIPLLIFLGEIGYPFFCSNDFANSSSSLSMYLDFVIPCLPNASLWPFYWVLSFSGILFHHLQQMALNRCSLQSSQGTPSGKGISLGLDVSDGRSDPRKQWLTRPAQTRLPQPLQ